MRTGQLSEYSSVHSRLAHVRSRSPCPCRSRAAPVRSRPDEVSKAKHEMSRACDALHAAGGVSALRAESLFAETLMAVHGQMRPTQAEMYRRIAARGRGVDRPRTGCLIGGSGRT